MKIFNNLKTAFCLIAIAFLFNCIFTFSQTQLNTEGKYSYTTVENDPLKARIYKLNNGLTVCLTVYKNEPRIQTYIPVRAGSKNDPSDATGLAHYLEHMLFKGTDKFGSKDYSKEKPLVDEIIALYEKYRQTTDAKKRKQIYKQIDSVSGLAAKFSIANEYDKMMSLIGAKGTNAYTWVEQTVYTNDIPSNQLENWIMIEAERYRNPVMRLFHTELEAVYEEKNIGLDHDDNKAWDKLFENIFPTHQYGTQTTIGTIDHLKNPSIKKVIDYYYTYYVPNNMAICLSGDLDPDKTIELIDKYWGGKETKVVPVYNPPVEKEIAAPVVSEVFGQEAESVMLGFRFQGDGSGEADMITLIDILLANSQAGLLDLNLNQSQKVLASTSFTVKMKDYSAHVLSGNPRQGQKLEEVKDLLLGQIENVKTGNFPDWLIEATINDLKLAQMKRFESNRGRADVLVNTFIKGIDWEKEVTFFDRLSKITKQQVMDFATKHYTNNYAVVYKRQGEDKNVRKVEKPQITPVEVNRQDKSDFVKTIASSTPEDIQPVFVDYSTDLSTRKLTDDIELIYKSNDENDLFTLSFIFDIGNKNDKRLAVACGYLNYLGTSQYSASELQQEFYKLGCSYFITSTNDEVYFSLSGLNTNFVKAYYLFVDFLSDLKPDDAALENLEKDITKVRADSKTNQQTILWDAMFSYAKYGSKSVYTNVLSESELKALGSQELVNLLKSLFSYKYKITYYGPMWLETMAANLLKPLSLPEKFKIPQSTETFTELETNSNVYFVNYPGMVQAEIIFIAKGEMFNKNIVPNLKLYNEYFGGGMSSIVFQDLRESKALAYGTFSSFSTPKKKDESHYNYGYIGTQADKLPEAMTALYELMTNMPESEVSFSVAKKNLLQTLRTERITKGNVITSYLAGQKLGIDYDLRKDIFEKVQGMNINEVAEFQKSKIKNMKYNVLVLADKSKIDFNSLSKYGTVKTLTLEEVFSY